MSQAISIDALKSRIRRKLKCDGEALRHCKPHSRWHGQLGDFYVLDANNNSIVATHVDPVALGVELGVIAKAADVAA